MKRIAIDLVPIRPGLGGTGSGIWTYARELVAGLNRLEPADDVELYVLLTRDHRPFFDEFRHVHPVFFPRFGVGRITRLWWVHVWLPLWCAWWRMDGLHKLATETPLFCSARRVTTVHDFYHEFMIERQGARPSLTGRYFQWATRLCFRKSRAVITDTRTVCEEARRRFPVSPAALYPIPIATLLPDTGERPVRPTDHPFTFLYVAKLMPYKGQMEALAGWEALWGEESGLARDCRLVFHGFENDADYVRALDRRMAGSPAAGQLARSAYRPELDLDAIYGSADAVLFLSAYEGFGLPVIEAQARGLPVVCSDLKVLREVGGEGAVYVDRGDPVAIGAALKKVRTDGAWRAELVKKGRENAARYSWEETARATRRVYGEEVG